MNGQELTTAQVAERLGVSAVTARLWCRRGLFPNAYEQQTPRGAVWMIPESDLKGFESPKKTGRPRKTQIKKTAQQASKKGGRK